MSSAADPSPSSPRSRLDILETRLRRVAEELADARRRDAAVEHLVGRVADVEARLNTVTEAARQCDQEIDALQIAAATAERPWFRDASVLVSALAFLLSIVTTAVSIHKGDQQETQALRGELRGFIQRLSAIPRENLELTSRYGPVMGTQLSSALNAENRLIAHQAREVIGRIPDLVTPLEYNVVAFSLMAGGEYGEAAKLYQDAIKAADEVNDEVTARRGLATAHSAIGEVEEARKQYAAALQARRRYPSTSPWVLELSDFQTEMGWSVLEISFSECGEARVHADSAMRHLLRLPSMWAQSQAPQIDSLNSQVSRCRSISGGASDLLGSVQPLVPIRP
jgi:tetratricopeptide (TPR) repeat protein